MIDVMLDLETMGKGPNAAIVAIGAVGMDLVNGKLGKDFYVTISLESSVEAGGEMDASTVLWWMRQSDEARAELDGGGSWADAICRFYSFLKNNSDRNTLRVWGNGVDFDNVIMAQAFARHHLDVPWLYRNNRCYRTMRKLFPDVGRVVRDGTLHNAYDDAKNQALHLIKIFSEKSLKP